MAGGAWPAARGRGGGREEGEKGEGAVADRSSSMIWAVAACGGSAMAAGGGGRRRPWRRRCGARRRLGLGGKAQGDQEGSILYLGSG